MNTPTPHGSPQDALVALLQYLRARDYQFVTPTPDTHARILGRNAQAQAATLRGIFGWSLPFERSAFAEVADLLEQAGCLVQDGALCRASVRVASLDGFLFLHSAYPTLQSDSVFFGPDTYKFIAFLRRHLPSVPPQGVIIDIGTGAGPAGILVASRWPKTPVILSDINARALDLCRANAAFAGVPVTVVEAPDIAATQEPIGLALANPPYIAGESARVYRDGGDMLGARLAFEWAKATMHQLAPGGRLLLYTGVTIIEGINPLKEVLQPVAAQTGCTLACEEIDPDVFGNELDRDAYRDAERIAVCGLVISRRH